MENIRSRFKGEDEKIARRMARPRTLFKMYKLFNNLCPDCKQYCEEQVANQQKPMLVSFCPDCQERARPILESVRKSVDKWLSFTIWWD